jgi:hypothetical protein
MGVRACVLAASLAACSRSSAPSGPEARIAEDLGAQLGVTVERVRCPAGAYPKACTAEIEGTDGLPVRVVETDAGYEWTLEDFVISTRPLAAEIAIELDDLGVEATVDCGAVVRVTRVGDRIECAIAGEKDGLAWARILDEEAHFELELLLGAAAIEARTRPGDPAELERMSRELDDGVTVDGGGGVAGVPE